jgi:hypothetical protein
MRRSDGQPYSGDDDYIFHFKVRPRLRPLSARLALSCLPTRPALAVSIAGPGAAAAAAAATTAATDVAAATAAKLG